MVDRFKVAKRHHSIMKMNRGVCFSQWRFLHDSFKKLDKFGHPISLTYKGRDKFQTPWGACVSLCVAMLMLWVILVIFSQIVT